MLRTFRIANTIVGIFSRVLCHHCWWHAHCGKGRSRSWILHEKHWGGRQQLQFTRNQAELEILPVPSKAKNCPTLTSWNGFGVTHPSKEGTVVIFSTLEAQHVQQSWTLKLDVYVPCSKIPMRTLAECQTQQFWNEANALDSVSNPWQIYPSLIKVLHNWDVDVGICFVCDSCWQSLKGWEGVGRTGRMDWWILQQLEWTPFLSDDEHLILDAMKKDFSPRNEKGMDAS